MSKQKLSKTKELLFALTEHLKEQGALWENFAIGISHPLYKRTFMGGGAEAVRRRRQSEANYAYQQELAALKRRRWILIRQRGEKLHLTLTEKGRMICIKERMKRARLCRKNECIIVIFDIPEQERALRRRFRHFLKECDFKQLQRSVWISRCDVLTMLREFIHSTKSNEWIRAFRVSDITE